MALSRWMRSSVGGCVDISAEESAVNVRSGFTMNRCWVPRFSPGTSAPSREIFSSAEASPSGFRVNSAPAASAWYSRCREMLIWSSRAASGASTASTIPRSRKATFPRPPPPPPLRPLPRGEGVDSLCAPHVPFRHGQSRRDFHLLDDVPKLLMFLGIGFPGIVDREDDRGTAEGGGGKQGGAQERG